MSKKKLKNLENQGQDFTEDDEDDVIVRNGCVVDIPDDSEGEEDA